MNILAKYCCREFFKLLIVCLLIFTSLYMVIHFVGAIDNFIEAGVPKGLVFSYFAYSAPHMLVQMLPPATLIATIIMFASMKKNNEILIMKASGMNVWGIARPIFVVSLFLAMAQCLFSEIIVPYTSSRSNDIWRTEVKKRNPGLFYGRSHIWYKGSRCIYWIRHFDAKKMAMENLTFYFFDQSFRMLKKIDAKSGIWEKNKWVIRDGTILETKDYKDYSMTKFKQIELNLPETPETFQQEKKDPEEMSYLQLRQFVKRLGREGYDTTEYLVDMNIKPAFCLINVIMVLIGIPIALGLKKGGTPLALSLGVAVCFLYLISLGVARAFGLSSILPPILSAWLANGIFFLIGIYFLKNVDR
jgi:lipopolysaccharide export system permease protein